MTLEIKNQRKGNKYVLLIILLIVIFSFLAPIVLTLVLFSELQSGFLLSIVIFWIVGFYFLRLLLWNLYGKERYDISQREVIIYHDFRFFRILHGRLKTDSLEVGFVPASTVAYSRKSHNKSYFSLIFITENSSIQSGVQLERDEVIALHRKIRNAIKKT